MQSCLEHDPELAVVATAAVTSLLCHTVAGRMLAKKRVTDTDFLPRRHIFFDSGRAPGDRLDFRKLRWTWLFASKIFGDLLPAAARHLKELAGPAREVVAEREMLKWTSNIGIEQIERKTRRFVVLPDEPASAKPNLVKGPKRRAHAISFKTLTGGKIDPAFIVKADKAVAKLQARVRRDYGGILSGIGASAGTVIELMNVCLATTEKNSATPKDKTRAMISFVGAWLDLGSQVMGVAGESLEKLLRNKEVAARIQGSARIAHSTKNLKYLGYGVRGVKGLAGAFGLVAAVIDMVDFGTAAVKAGAANDYGLCVGRAFQATGALLSAGVSAMVLAEAMAGSACFGPAGLILGVIAATLVIAGALIASWWRSRRPGSRSASATPCRRTGAAPGWAGSRRGPAAW